MISKILDFKCGSCNHIFEKKFKREKSIKDRYDCPECKMKNSCYRIWPTAFSIPEHMKAQTKFKGAVQTHERFKKYKGQTGSKRIFQGGGVNEK